MTANNSSTTDKITSIHASTQGTFASTIKQMFFFCYNYFGNLKCSKLKRNLDKLFAPQKM